MRAADRDRIYSGVHASLISSRFAHMRRSCSLVTLKRLKQEVTGIPRFEGSEAIMRLVAYGFVICEREMIPRQGLISPGRSRN
jgi:hypothetical protein